MVIVGGSHGRYYRCGDAHKRANCKNTTPLREDLLTQAVLDHMVGVLRSEETMGQLRAEAESMVREAARTSRDDEKRVRKSLVRVENEIERLVEAIKALEMVSGSNAFAILAKDLERTGQEKRKLEAELASVRAQTSSAPPLPTTDDLVRLTQYTEDDLRADPIAFREVLRRMTADGKITLEPQPNDGYVAHAFFMPLVVPPPPKRGGIQRWLRGQDLHRLRPLVPRQTPTVTSRRHATTRSNPAPKWRKGQLFRAGPYRFGCAGLHFSQYTRRNPGVSLHIPIPRPPDKRRLPEQWVRRKPSPSDSEEQPEGLAELLLSLADEG